MKEEDIRVKNTVLSGAELIKKLEVWFKAGSGPFPLTVTGHSMTPFIAPGRDTAFLYPFDGTAKKGDIILFISVHGRLLLHRVKKTDGQRIVTAGDAFSHCDEGTDVSHVLAVCRSVKRKEKIYDEKSLFWRFFSAIWINVLPLRKPILRGYAALKKTAGRSAEE